MDQIAVSSRDFSEIWILDHSTTTAEAATSSGGKSGKGGDILYRYGNPQVYDRGTAEDQVFFFQHNIEWINDTYPNGGSLSVFNNRWQSERSRVERWTPPMDGDRYVLDGDEAYGPAEPDWTYDEEGFYATRISGVQFLENGNAFVCSGVRGTFFEVTEEGRIVWEYINPMRSTLGPTTQGEPPFQNSVFRALRYSPDYAAFDGRDLSPGEPIELDPLPSDCIITHVEEMDSAVETGISIRHNVVHQNAEIFSRENTEIRILSLDGHQVAKIDLLNGVNHIDMSGVPSGVYFLAGKTEVLKLIKM